MLHQTLYKIFQNRYFLSLSLYHYMCRHRKLKVVMKLVMSVSITFNLCVPYVYDTLGLFWLLGNTANASILTRQGLVGKAAIFSKIQISLSSGQWGRGTSKMKEHSCWNNSYHIHFPRCPVISHLLLCSLSPTIITYR